jgi:hypothetical protein
MRTLVLALVLAFGGAAGVSAATQSPGGGAFLSAYAPADRAAFEAGYRRHLAWHRDNGDSLAWFGWDVIAGPRTGAFIDGVFGTPFEALDVRVDPAGDRADAAANVLPNAESLPRELLLLRPELSSATPLESRAPTPLVQVLWIAVDPGAMESIRALLGSLQADTPGGALLPYTVYERAAGGSPGYVLMIWRERLASFDAPDTDPARALALRLGERKGQGASRAVPWTTEVWLYRPDLTYLGTSGAGP